MRVVMLLRTYWFAVTLLLLAIITLLSLTPMPHLPTVPGGDKIQHFSAYAALMFSVALRQPKYWLAIGLFLIFWSGAIELIQPFVNRHSDWMDLLANSGGIVTGSVLAMLINYLFPQSSNAE